MSEIKAWANTVGQQIENMNVDLVAQTAAGVSEASGDVFFVGRPAQNGTDWILKKITPTELEKMVYNYLTSNSIAPQLAAVLGGMRFADSSIVNYADMTVNGLYTREPSTGISGSDINIGWDGTYLYIAHFKFGNLGTIDIATIYNHSKYWIGFANDWREI